MKIGGFVLLAFISAVLFGASTPASKALLDKLSSFQLAGFLYLGAALGVMPFALFSKKKLLKIDKNNTLRLLGAILFGGIVGPVLLLFGLKLASAASVAMWLNLEAVATAVLGYLVFKDHLGKYSWIGVTATVAVGVLLAISEPTAGPAACALVACACICWGVDNHLTALIDGFTPAQSTFYKGLGAGAVNLSIGVVAAPLPLSETLLLVALCVGTLSYGASITLYITSAQQIGATRAQIIFATAPFFGVILAAIFLGETLTVLQIGAGFILVFAIAMLFLDKHDHNHSHNHMAHTHMHRHDDGHHNHTHDKMPALGYHSHYHEHEPIEHSHPHLPDLHHRHEHQ